MTRRLALLLATMVVLTGCSPDDAVVRDASDKPSVGEGDHRIAATDGSFTIEVPEDWTSLDESIQSPIVVAAQGEDKVDQLIISVFDDVEGAQDQAIFTAAGLADGNIICKRLEDSTVFGDARLVFDCPQQFEGSTVRKLFIPIENDDASLLVLVQTSGESLADTAAVVTPILESLTFE